jgi:two-component system OmpR family sensor kinase
MPPEIAARAFHRFVRGGTDRGVSRGSSGLGLSIVAAIVEAHGGQVGLTSTAAGTQVTVELPVFGRP